MRTSASPAARLGLTAAGVLLACALPSAPVCAATLEGYASRMTVQQGDSLELHVRCALSKYKVSLWRPGPTLQLALTVNYSYPGLTYPPGVSEWDRGCAWPVTCRIPIAPDLRPGAYLVRLESGAAIAWVPFVVRARVPGSYSKILVQLAVNTWQAYNTYGGKSLYKSNVAGDPVRAYRVSFQRPYRFPVDDGSGQIFQYEGPFMEFLEREGIAYEVCTNLDLHTDSHLLDAYRLFISVGHDEYWSKEMFDQLEAFVDSGGNLAVFAGNAMWWQVRFEDQARTMVCYKDATLDPMTAIDPSRVTVNWHSPPVHRYPGALTGLYYNGSYGISPGAFQVVNPHHWAFRGIAVDSGQTFGYPMVAYEVDARHVSSPAAIELVARAELPDANNGDLLRACEMTYYERTPAYGYPNGRGGKVFAAGTVNYAQGLTGGYNVITKTYGATDPVARQVTLNVIDRLGCWITPPQLAHPAHQAVVTGEKVLLQWHAAATQRFGAPVEYRLHWQQAGAAASEFMVAVPTALSAWIPVEPDTQYEWWIDAVSGCGDTQQSARRRFSVQHATDAQPPASLPVLRAHTEADRATIQLALNDAAEVKIGIYDTAGRRVRFFQPGRLAPGMSRIDWDLADARGQRVASGLYFVRAWVGANIVQTRFAVVR